MCSGLGVDAPMPSEGACANGTWPRGECLVLRTGVGPLAASFSIGILLGGLAAARFPLRLALLNVGLAGSFDLQAAPLRSLALADAECWPEYGVATSEGVDARALGFPMPAGHGEPVWDRLPLEPDAALADLGLRIPAGTLRGCSLTVAGVSGDAARAELWRRRHAPLTENMEGFALALACRRFSVPFAELRAVSNLVAERDKKAWDIPGALQALEQGLREAALLS